ncbi:hypothetical protein [Hoeflea sp.]|uniref:hypothetical protein n=1 Tax=Hoeflea sp. TaxID=1940281 RepID=UPI003B51ABAF
MIDTTLGCPAIATPPIPGIEGDTQVKKPVKMKRDIVVKICLNNAMPHTINHNKLRKTEQV